jgi:hypothetical protein
MSLKGVYLQDGINFRVQRLLSTSFPNHHSQMILPMGAILIEKASLNKMTPNQSYIQIFSNMSLLRTAEIVQKDCFKISVLQEF